MAKHDANTKDVKRGSGDVFADLAVADPEESLAKAKLAARIAELIARRGLTQAESAEILGLDQPKASALVRGKLSGFSTERLFRFLNDLGQDVESSIRPAKPAKGRGRVRISTRTK